MKTFLLRSANNTTSFEVITDTADDNRSFEIAELRNLDDTEIQGGFDFIVGDLINEGDLMQYARENNFIMEKYLNGRRVDIFMMNRAYGRFNGMDSELYFGDVTFPSAPATVRIRLMYRFSENINLPTMGLMTPQLLISNNVTGPSMQPTSVRINPSGPNMGAYQFQMVGQAINFVTSIDYAWHEVTADASITSSSLTLTISIDGVQVQTQDFTGSFNPSNANARFVVGGQGTGLYFNGDIMNIEMTANSTVFINCPNPATGVNTGTLGNGAPSNIVQGIV